MAVMKRQTAHRTWISNLSQSKYVKQEGWDPNYVELDGKQVSRVSLLATVVSKFVSEDGNYAAITIDDGSDTIRVKAFGPDVAVIKDLQVGVIIRFVGKVKEYNEELHLSAEVARVVEDPNWLLVWKLEQGTPKAGKPAQKIEVVQTEPEAKEEPSEKAEVETEKIEANPEETQSAKVLEIIKKLDSGEGAKTEDVMKESGLEKEEAKNVVVNLLKSGDVYEPKKGILKPL